MNNAPIRQSPPSRPSGVGKVMLRQAAYSSIEDLLNQGHLKPGQMVSQRELVDATGLTLGAVREAIPRLEAEGLLTTLPQRGLMVPSLDVGFVRDAYQLRLLMEVAAVPAAMQTLPPQWFQEWIRRHEEALVRLKRDQDPVTAQEFQRLDWELHAQMIGAMGNALMTNVYRVTAIKIRMAVQSRIRVTLLNAERIMIEHLAFLRLMAEGKEAAAVDAMKKHVGNSLTLALGGEI